MKEDLRIKKTKASLYRSIIQLTENQKYEDIKISQICSTAKMNRTTFYDHFKDKNELLESFINDTIIELENTIEIENKPKNIKEYYKTIMNCVLNHIVQNLKEFKIIANINNNGMMNNLLQNLLINITTKNIEKNNPEISPNIIKNNTTFYMSGCVSIIMNNLTNKKSFSKDDIYKILLEFLPNKITK